jgi:hypothetical protein
MSKKRKQHAKSNQPGRPGRIWLIISAVVTAGIVVSAMISGDSKPRPAPAASLQNPAPTPPAAAAAPAAAVATPAGPAGPAPRISFVTPFCDFGRAKGDDTVECVFIYTNTGTATLELTEIAPSCGCMKIGDWTQSVPPGGSGKCTVRVDTHHYTGGFAKSVYVTCNDPANTKPMIEVKGYIFRPIELTPPHAAITLNLEYPSNSTTVRIVGHQDAPLILGEPVVDSPAFGATITTNTAGKEYTLTVSTRPPLPTGYVRGAVKMKTSYTNAPDLSVDISANVWPLIMPIPMVIQLPAPPFTNAHPHTMWIRNNSTNTVTLTEPKVSVPGVEVQMKEEQPGRHFALTLRFPPGFELKQGQNAELTVKCSHPLVPVVKVPITQAPRIAGQ